MDNDYNGLSKKEYIEDFIKQTIALKKEKEDMIELLEQQKIAFEKTIQVLGI